MEAFVPIGSAQEPETAGPVPEPRVRTLELTDTYGRFALEPLERGFATTLGNPLRRALLSSIPGVAITWVRIEGALQEYSSLPHVKEDVMDLLQRVKSIRLRALREGAGRMRLEVRGPGEVFAGDIATPASLEVVNPEMRLTTIDSPEGTLSMEFNVEAGKGYLPSQGNEGYPIGTLSVDAIFTPVRKVSYAVERTRVGQMTDFERLVVEVWTDGSVSPQEALRKAAQVLTDHLTLVAAVGTGAEAAGGAGRASAISPEVYNVPVERLELSSRTQNSLKRAGINKVGEILEKSRTDLLRIRNFGEKSLEEVVNRLKERDLPIPEPLQGAQEEASGGDAELTPEQE